MFYVVRHGFTEWNIIRKVQGVTDKDLTDEGRRQAEKAREEIKDIPLDFIITSPLSRARETAEIMNRDHKVPVMVDDRLLERNFGIYEGVSRSEMDYSLLWDFYNDVGEDVCEPNRIFFARVWDFLRELSEKCPDKNVLIATHGGVSIAVECYFREEIPHGKLSQAGLSIKNCQVKGYEPKTVERSRYGI